MDDELGSLRWFGPPWGASACVPAAEVFLPAGTVCSGCLNEIGIHESGVRFPHIGAYKTHSWYHLNCFLTTIGVDAVNTPSTQAGLPALPN